MTKDEPHIAPRKTVLVMGPFIRAGAGQLRALGSDQFTVLCRRHALKVKLPAPDRHVREYFLWMSLVYWSPKVVYDCTQIVTEFK